MSRKFRTVQNSFTSGELDPLLSERGDLAVYYSGCLEMTNVVPLPQGGFRLRGGQEFINVIRNQFDAVSTAGATASAPNGGTPANAIDGNPATVLTTTTNIDAMDPYVVLHLDFTAPVSVNMVDVTNIKLSSGLIDDEFRIQSSTDNAVWTDFGAIFNLDINDRSRRRTSGPTITTAARYWRLVRVGATVLAATVTVEEVSFLVENVTASEVRLISFAFSNEEQYIIAMTDGNLDFYSQGVFVASASVPYTTAEIDTVAWTQSLDTLLIFHKNHAPFTLFRQGDDDEWDFRDQEFTNIPQYDFGDSPGGTNEVQQLNFLDFLTGETFNIFLEDQRTSSINFDASIVVTAASVQAALRALPNTSSNGITCAGSGTTITVTFAGDDGLTNWPEMIPAILNTVAGSVFTSTVTEGEAPGEDIISTIRGWPRCGAFYQGRLWMGGFRSLPSFFLFGTAGTLFNLNDRSVRDDQGAVAVADTDQAAVIYQMFPARHMQIFTSSAEFYVPSEPVTPTTISLKQSTRRGTIEGLRPIEIDGPTLFVQKGGNALRQFLFNDVEQNYVASNISILASHLIDNPTGVAVRRAKDATAADIYAMVNDTTDMTIVTIERTQGIAAFARFRTDGRYLSTAAEDLGDLYVAVEREIDGNFVKYLERFNTEHFMDAGKIVAVAPGTEIITDLEYLEGKTLDLIIDRSPGGSAVVTGGQITLPFVAEEEVILGLDWKPRVETMPVKPPLPEGSSIGKKGRITEVNASIFETTSLRIGVNDREPRDVLVRTFGDKVLDFPQFDSIFTGVVKKAGGLGWTKEPTVVFDQIEPGPLTVRAAEITVAM